MKTEGFVKLLRKVIREEVRNVVKAELKPLINEVKINKHDINLHEIHDTPNQTTQPVAHKKYSKDPLLNEMLNDTASTPASAEMAEWQTMNFRSEMAQAMGMTPPGPAAPLATTGINGEAINMNNEAVKTTVNAMTRDYSALMKAIDKKKSK